MEFKQIIERHAQHMKLHSKEIIHVKDETHSCWLCYPPLVDMESVEFTWLWNIIQALGLGIKAYSAQLIYAEL